MNTIALLKTTALAGIVAMMPVVFAETADAGANIKIKPKVKTHVKVKPKIKINKAKIRNNAKSNNQQVVVKKAKKSPQITATPKQIQKKPVVTASLNPGYPDLNIVPVPEQRPVEFENRFGQFEELQGAREAAEAAKELEQLARLGTDTKDMDLANPDLGTGHSSNQDVLNGMFQKDGKDGIGGSNAARFGPDTFAGIPDTHGKGPANANGTSAADAAAGFWGVTQDRINAGIGGIAGKGDVKETPGMGAKQVVEPKPSTESGRIGGGYSWHPSTRSDDGGHVHTTYRRDPNWTHSVTTTYSSDYSSIERQTEVIISSGRWTRRITRDFGERTWEVQVIPNGGGDAVITRGSLDNGPQPEDTGPKVAERRDPDSGYAGPSPFPWINERENQLTKLTPGTGGKTPGALPQDPAVSKGSTNTTQAAVSLNDLLETWDEDSRRSGSPQPIDTCHHSEC